MRGLFLDHEKHSMAPLQSGPKLPIFLFMAVLYRAQEAFAATIGESYSALDRMVNSDLKPKGLVPDSPRGGGKNAVHCQVEHLWRLPLGFSARRPNEAAETTRVFETMPYQGPTPHGLPPPAPSLGLALYRTTEMLAGPLSMGQEMPPHVAAIVGSWELVLCKDILEAQITMDDGSGPVVYFFAAEDVPPTPPMRRLTIYGGSVLLTIAKLLADTYIHENALAAIQFLDRTKPGRKPTPKTKNAGSLGGEPTPLGDQPSANSAGDVSPDSPLIYRKRQMGKGKSSSPRSGLVKVC